MVSIMRVGLDCRTLAIGSFFPGHLNLIAELKVKTRPNDDHASGPPSTPAMAEYLAE